MENKSGYFVVHHGVFYRNGEVYSQSISSDRTLSVAELDELNIIKQRYLNQSNKEK